ncbi:metal-dependent hydrolase [Halomarina halobia]|uniref:Metal-dependent hydrolase n=1 Tax=Halomarina halobia TaxID=3033386 RepID=A0ABD6A8L7_9EURY|nr:metal-dependent hydrolase [Halomarina sp. PSR21]
MPSLLVHVVLGLLLGAALLRERLTRRAALAVVAATAFPDLDAFAGLYVPGSHRALLHTLVIPAALAVALAIDTHLRDEGFVLSRFGSHGVQIAWACLLAYAVAGIGLDLVNGGANVLYPIHDQFYDLDGAIVYSTTDGFVQTYVQSTGLAAGGDVGGGAIYVTGGERTGAVDAGQFGSSGEVHVSSPVDPVPGPEPPGTERVFTIVKTGWQLLLLFAGVVAVVGRRLLRRYDADRREAVRPAD